MLKLFLLGFLCLHSYGRTIVILVHGSFAHHADWYRPGGDFFQELKTHANKDNHELMYHQWSGSLKNSDRIDAARSLAMLILELRSSQNIVLVGHSHGGTVILLASNLLQQSNPHVHFQTLSDATLFFQAHQDIQKLKRGLSIAHDAFLIDRTYLLGTPIDTSMVAPNMQIIRSVINLYSYADYIQTMLGFYTNIIDHKERTVNLEVFIDDAHAPNKPSHIQMHHPLIGRSLLDIGRNDPQEWSHDGIIVFHAQNPPAYLPMKKRALRAHPTNLYAWH